MARERRFLVDPSDIEEGRATIRGEEWHHLARVLRLRAGDDLSVFDGRGRGFRARLESIAPGGAVALLLDPEDPEIEPRCRAVLLQGIPHGERMDWIVEKATEIGAAAVVPVVSARSVVRPRKGGWAKVERWRRIALAAAKQSGRLVVPEVAEPVSFEEALAWSPRAKTGGPPLRLILHTEGVPVPGEARLPPAPQIGGDRSDAALLVGPEGGWTEEEFGAAAGAGWSPVWLGRRILRADTAAAVALGLLLVGGWGEAAVRSEG